MSEHSSIEWTDATWNPVRGCVKISPGCSRCYAATFAERWRGIPGHPYEQGFDLRLVPEKLEEPLKWRNPKRVFVNSMSDLFQDGVPDDFIAQVFDVMRRAPRHTFQLLTKRAERMRDWVSEHAPWVVAEPHIWLGVSVEDIKYGVPRLDALRETPAALRFLSVEPLLEKVSPLDLEGIGWVIVGGESGPRCRPMEADWVRAVRQDCADQDVPFFFKQWGGTRKKLAGRELDGRTWDAMPEVLLA